MSSRRRRRLAEIKRPVPDPLPDILARFNGERDSRPGFPDYHLEAERLVRLLTESGLAIMSARNTRPDREEIITAAQIRGALGMLGWSYEEAGRASKLASSTVSLAARGSDTHPKTEIALRTAFEAAGVAFTFGSAGELGAVLKPAQLRGYEAAMARHHWTAPRYGPTPSRCGRREFRKAP